MKRQHRVLFSDLAAADPSALPTEFLIFRAGENHSTKGTYLFDDEAARMVMGAYATQGVDLMLDLEHHSLDAPIRQDSADARAWFRLELRGGDLYAVDLRMTPDGARRLAEKTQRYTSPAFFTDENGRITELINVALCAMPATHQAAPLVAASKARGAWGCAPPASGYTVVRSPRLHNKMTPDQVKKIMAALEANDVDALAAVCKELLAAAASGGEAPAEPAGGEALGDTAQTPPAEEEPAAQLAALTVQLTDLRRVQSETIAALTSQVRTLTDERDATNQVERLALVGKLVKLCAETPATAWSGDPEKRVVVKRLQDESIASLRARVVALSANGVARGFTPPAEAEPEWTAAEQKALLGMKPEQQAQFKAIRASRRNK